MTDSHQLTVTVDSRQDVDQDAIKDKKKGQKGVVYGINESPPWYLAVVLGLQHYLTMFGGTVSIFLIVSSALCIDLNLVLKAEMLGTVFFIMGITTLLQSTFGTRLPIIQGSTGSLLLPVLSMAKTLGDCPTTIGNVTTENITNEVIYPRIQMVSGTLMVGSLLQILIGMSGAVNLLLRFIGPLVIAPTISLIGLSLFEVAYYKAQGQWWIALTTSLLICFFTYFLAQLKVPIPLRSRDSGWYHKKVALFKTCPVLLGITVSWCLCAILTAAGAFPEEKGAWGYVARTDAQIAVVHATPWFQFPYPGRWGAPRPYLIALLGLAAGFITSVVESVGDYFACSKMAGAPQIPAFAVNRGIAMEGIGCFLAGALGLPIGTTSYSENVAAIGITRVGSRRVVQWAAVFMLVFGVFSKMGAIFVSIPDPIYGGVFLTMFAMLTGVGLSNLQYVDLNSSRNLFIIGTSLFAGLMLPFWIVRNGDKIQTGSSALDDTLRILLAINMFVGGTLAFILDLVLPGTAEERGILKWRKNLASDDNVNNRREVLKTYDLKIFRKFFPQFPRLRFFPVCPTYAKYSAQSEMPR